MLGFEEVFLQHAMSVAGAVMASGLAAVMLLMRHNSARDGEDIDWEMGE